MRATDKLLFPIGCCILILQKITGTILFLSIREIIMFYKCEKRLKIKQRTTMFRYNLCESKIKVQ